MPPTPYIVESTLTNIGQPLGPFQGPFLHGTDRYVACQDFISPTANMGAFKSADTAEPFTFAVQDQANEASYFNSFADVFRPLTGGDILHYTFFNGAGVKLKDFDMSSDTWGATVTGGPGTNQISNADGGNALLIVRLSNGHRVVVYQELVHSGGNHAQSLYVDEYDGAAWVGPTLIKLGVPGSSGLTSLLCALVVDASDRVHIFRQDNYRNIGGGFPGSKVIHNSYAAGALSGETQIGPDCSGTGGYFGHGVYRSPQDEIIVPTAKFGGFQTNDLALIRATPSSAPVFTIEEVANQAAGQGFSIPEYGCTPNGTKEYVFCLNEDASPVPHEQIVYFKNTGSGWDATSTLWWDEYLNPPTPPQVLYNDLSPFSVQIFDNAGAIAATVGLFSSGPGGDFCSVQYYLETPGAPLSVACPVTNTGTQGIPFTATIIVSGGTPPYTFAITDGSLPPGLTLNTSTGVISGTPTMGGTFTWTVTVTDADMSTADVECSTTISVPTPVRPQKICVRQA